MRYILLLFILLSCSENRDTLINSGSFKHKEFFIKFIKTNDGGIISDRHSCLGWSEIRGCEIESKKYIKNSFIEVWAFPYQGYNFIGWSGSYDSVDNPLLISVDSDKEIIAMFSE